MTTTTHNLGHNVTMTCDKRECEFVFEGNPYTKKVLGRSMEEMVDYAKKTLMIRYAERMYRKNKDTADGKYILTAPLFEKELREQYPDKHIVTNRYLTRAYVEGKGWCFTDEEPLTFIN